MPDFDVFSLLDIRRRNRRSRGKRKNGNLKRKHKNKTFWTLTDLWKILKSGCHQMFSKLSSHALYMLLQNYTRPTRPVLYTSRVGEAINFTCVSHYSGHKLH